METALPDDGFVLGNSLREHDKEEIRHTWGEDTCIPEALSKCIEISDVAYALSSDDGRLHGLWGHGMWNSGTVKNGMGYIWLLSDAELFERWGLTMTKAARLEIFPALDKMYGMYGNFVMAKNTVHCRWLLRGGFRRTAHSTIAGEPYSLYLRYGNHV